MRPNNNLMYEIGKIPPQAIEVEQAVLGALILEPGTIIEIGNILKPEMFYKESHQHVYAAIQNMNDNNAKIDMLTIVQELKKTNKLEEVGGAYYITNELVSMVASAAHIDFHARVIRDHYIKRRFINIATLISQKAYDMSYDSDDLLTFANKEIESIYMNEDSGVILLADGINQLMEEVQKRQGNHTCVDGFQSDIKSLRELVPTWENGRLIVFAARPGMGKTALAIHECINSAKSGKPSIYFSLEMSYKQLIKRFLQNDSDIKKYMFEVNDLKDKQWDELDKGITKIYDYKIFIDDNSFTLSAIKNRCKILKKKHGIGSVFIDYLQLIESDKNAPREQQVAQMSRACKLLSKELDLPIFLLAQLNRESENRKENGFMPKLADLRESGAVEQDADIVAFPHRACYYEPDNERAWIIIAKNRDGKTGKAEVRTNETVTRFYDPFDNNDLNFNHGNSPF